MAGLCIARNDYGLIHFSIMLRIFSIIRRFDWLLLGAVVLLICFGLAALYSITVSFEQPNFFNFQKQVLFALAGLALLFSLGIVDYRFWKGMGGIAYLAAAGLLVTVLFLGRVISGTRGWVVLGGVNFQPVELAKLALLIFLAGFLSTRTVSTKGLLNFLLSGLAAAVLCGLVLLQPDFGSAIILFLLWFLLTLLAGADKRYVISVMLLFAVLFGLSWVYFFQDYQRDRIMTFFNPQADPYNRGYHVRQATIAVGAGGWLGRGLGFGSQSQLKFIPASQTDFIFAVVAEELGFFGVSLVLVLWAVVFYRLGRAALRCRDDFATLFIVGVSIVFFSQVMINIGMNVGLLPVTGIALPFLSYGGSFLVVSLMLVGLVQSMVARTQR